MTNQASEIAEQIIQDIRKWHDGQWDYNGDDPRQKGTEAILGLIRTEKLKLLAEVRERVVGEDVKESNYVLNMGVAHNPPKDTTRTNLIRQGANLTKAEQRENLNKLEAEL